MPIKTYAEVRVTSMAGQIVLIMATDSHQLALLPLSAEGNIEDETPPIFSLGHEGQVAASPNKIVTASLEMNASNTSEPRLSVCLWGLQPRSESYSKTSGTSSSPYLAFFLELLEQARKRRHAELTMPLPNPPISPPMPRATEARTSKDTEDAEPCASSAARKCMAHLMMLLHRGISLITSRWVLLGIFGLTVTALLAKPREQVRVPSSSAMDMSEMAAATFATYDLIVIPQLPDARTDDEYFFHLI
ncbi:hypothetical protein FRC04_005971 [Tulasnella sp. 424]|nr:hypothetical protein FRC04_005971 [Tulasnella sp. 424]KAG8961444.1 hypothetical protein FRC05_005939 [Tulasnella sp. 425]